MSVKLRSGCADARGQRQKKWHSHFAAAVPAQGAGNINDIRTSQRLCRLRRPRKKEMALTRRSFCASAGRREHINDTHTSQRLRWRRGARKKEMALTLRSGCAGAGGEKA